jgi:hypothetical protein
VNINERTVIDMRRCVGLMQQSNDNGFLGEFRRKTAARGQCALAQRYLDPLIFPPTIDLYNVNDILVHGPSPEF